VRWRVVVPLAVPVNPIALVMMDLSSLATEWAVAQGETTIIA
jgi:hypothetical protein